jgi:predicted PurR-regulated permease PerM
MLNSQNRFFILTVLLLTLVIIYCLSPILCPFLTAALLAYLANPVVNKLTHCKLSRLMSVVIVFMFLFALIVLACLLLVPFIERQINELFGKIPDILDWTQTSMIPWLSDQMDIKLESIDAATLKNIVTNNLSKAGGVTGYLFTFVLHSGVTALAWLMNIVLIPVVTFYLLCDWPMILNNFRILLPRRIEPEIVTIAAECDEVLGAFFRGQLLVMLALATIYSIGLSVIGLQLGLLLGLIAGLLSIVPYLGLTVGVISASIAAYIQFRSFTAVGMVIAVFIVGQMTDAAILTPRLVGNRIGLHPVAVIFAILAGGYLFGFVGVLLALPVAAVLLVCLRHLEIRYQASKLYKS